jgi:hypothetical protein
MLTATAISGSPTTRTTRQPPVEAAPEQVGPAAQRVELGLEPLPAGVGPAGAGPRTPGQQVDVVRRLQLTPPLLAPPAAVAELVVADGALAQRAERLPPTVSRPRAVQPRQRPLHSARDQARRKAIRSGSSAPKGKCC